MNWQEALSRIESPAFDAELNMVSGTSAFLRAARKQPAVQTTLQLMRESKECREAVLGRICDLAMQETDPRYENPNDTPLAILLWLTCYTEPDFARLGARFVARAPRCWYANRLAHQIIGPPVASSVVSGVRDDTASRVSFHNSSTVDRFSVFLSPAEISVTSRLGDGISRTSASGTEHHVSRWDSDPKFTDSEPVVGWPYPVSTSNRSSLDMAGWFQPASNASAAGAKS